jgi:hypothetical protein
VCVFVRPVDDYQSTRRHIPEDRHIRMFIRLNVTAVAVLVLSVLRIGRFNHHVSLILEGKGLNVQQICCRSCEEKRG